MNFKEYVHVLTEGTFSLDDLNKHENQAYAFTSPTGLLFFHVYKSGTGYPSLVFSGSKGRATTTFLNKILKPFGGKAVVTKWPSLNYDYAATQMDINDDTINKIIGMTRATRQPSLEKNWKESR